MQEQLDRIEAKLDEISEKQAVFSVEVTWFKTVGAAIITSVAGLYAKIYGGT